MSLSWCSQRDTIQEIETAADPETKANIHDNTVQKVHWIDSFDSKFIVSLASRLDLRNQDRRTAIATND
jgi:hypothetical protein